MAKNKSRVVALAHTDDPRDIAEGYLKAEFVSNGKRLIHYYNTQFWVYEATQYEGRSEESVKNGLTNYINRLPLSRKPNTNLLNTTWSFFKSQVALSDNRKQPSWLTSDGLTADHNHIAFQNGILNLEDATSGGGSTLWRDHSPDWFSPTCLPFNYDVTARWERWEAFLNDVFERDCERIALLQEWFGYCLTPDTSHHAFMLLEGPPRSGKGTTAFIQRRLLGISNSSTVRLERFGDRFQLASTVGKLLNVIDETDGVKRFDEGTFKSYVAGERMLFDVKNRSPFEADPTARVLMLCNERPPIFDRSGGMFGRMLILPFRKSYIGRENTNLRCELLADLCGIFNWAVRGRMRLRGQGRFTQPAISQRERAVYELESNPARMFLEENVVVDTTGRVGKRALFETYFQWAKEGGYRPLNESNFSHEVRRHFKKQIGEARPTVLGKRVYVWTGIRHIRNDTQDPGANM
jgi:P4 family phage/plasmid primase-like protien